MISFPSPARPRRIRKRGPLLLAATAAASAVLAAGNGPRACGQGTGGVPDLRYFAGIEALYSGDHRDAQRIFRRGQNRSIRIGTERWVDSICYSAMLGEVYYQLGANADALAEFDVACQLYLQNPAWLLRVKFQNPPRPDTNRARRDFPPWGRSERQATLGQIPSIMLVTRGRLQSAEELKRQRVTVVEPPMAFKLHVPEIVRCTALAIRRRNELLGPLGKHDPISRDLVDALSRGGLAPANHWSNSWTELLHALALIGVERVDEAHTHLARSVVVEGRYDHALTCVALLAQGRLALEAGNAPLAARLLAEASFSAFYYDNPNVVDEALRLGSQNHLMARAPGVYPPLEAAAEWARRRGLRLLTANLRIAQAENLAAIAETEAASGQLELAARALGDMAAGRPGTAHMYVSAVVDFQRRRIEAAEKTLGQALVRQAAASLRGFQIDLANRLFDGAGGVRISSRVAVELYGKLLGDPLPEDWAQQPLDTLAGLIAPHHAAYDRWFLASLDRKDVLQAVSVSERAKRRRFLSALPWGGRLLALRALLEDPLAEADNEAALVRRQVLDEFPAYAEVSARAKTVRDELIEGPLLPADSDDPAAVVERYKNFNETVRQRENLLRTIALGRVPAPQLVPPLRTAPGLQNSLGAGQVIVLFHTVAGQMHGFLLTEKDYHTWQVGRAGDLRKPIAELLRELGNFGPGRNLTTADLSSVAWRTQAHQLYRRLFANSRLALGDTAELIIVPDDWLWHLPFELLVPIAEADYDVLIDQALVRYAPTASFAMDSRRTTRRVRHTAIVANESSGGAGDQFVGQALEQLQLTVAGPLPLPTPLPEPAPLVANLLDHLISFDTISLNATEPLDWSPLPDDRDRQSVAVGELLMLPWGAPQRVMLTGFSTAAENGLKGNSRRLQGASGRPGGEIFLSGCALASAGVQTALLSRWRTGGQTNLALVHEFAQELPHTSAAAAWQRSVLLARAAPLDVGHEPRLKASDDETAAATTADHPFLWAGYLLLDSVGDLSHADAAMPVDAAAQ